MKGKLIIIEGTDCSGKETQAKLLMEKLDKEGINIIKYSFPAYETATGKIIGGPYLGKKHIGESFFKEGASNVDPKVAALYYTADRKYNIPKVEKWLNEGINVILDRYVYSNFAHQAGKINDIEKRYEMYNFLEKLEFELSELPKADIKFFLHMPFENAKILKENRTEAPDGHESDNNHLILAEQAYIEVAKRYDFKTIKCSNEQGIRSIENINQELYKYVIEFLNK